MTRCEVWFYLIHFHGIRSDGSGRLSWVGIHIALLRVYNNILGRYIERV